MTFSDLKLSPSVLAALPSKLQSPTKIQQLAIPALLLNRDLLALAQTGSGKTLAFGLPLLDLTKSHHQSMQSVVIGPTRELAVQGADAISEGANNMVIGVLTLCGGVS
ncbi:MAG: DEAD/DEAH box helicase, partial [Gammaproteobacteria bacterium]|nr:DEAD/DEAH box helicase [Gammaproteobacteria bacterium]